MQKLNDQDFPKAKPIFRELRYNIVIDSVIDNNTHGMIWLDNYSNPKAAILWDMMGEILIEAVNNDLTLKEIKTIILKEIQPDAIKKHIPYLDIYYSKDLRERIHHLFKDENYTIIPRIVFEYNIPDIPPKILIPQACTLELIDYNLLQNNELEYLKHVKGWVNSFWKSERDFSSKGIGYCLIKENTILSWCLSVFVSGQNYEFGLETVPFFRKRGYGKITASACMDYCMKNNITPFWQSDKENIPSIKVSESAGFVKSFEYDLLRLKIIE